MVYRGVHTPILLPSPVSYTLQAINERKKIKKRKGKAYSSIKNKLKKVCEKRIRVHKNHGSFQPP